MKQQTDEKYSILGIISTIIMVLSTIPLYIGFLAKASVDLQRIIVTFAAVGFALAYVLGLIDLIFGKKNKNFAILTIVMETVIVVIIALAYIIL